MAKTAEMPRVSLVDRTIKVGAWIVVGLERNGPTGLVVTGSGGVAFGVGMIYVPAGVIVAGLLAVGLGMVLGRPR